MLELQIKGMTCGHCVRAVTRAVQGLDPAAKVDIDLASGRARIETAQPADRVAAAIREEGYAVGVA
ncbi:heavy-metal-associated domain-containing protein [Hydrocarboniphaga sp.]|uniref:heavy-metal-associated domain-containing protein n=1 Tax=Hydrocarboniphaga sp. TaxID=2033016 RepID=UPI003D0E3825